jgi:anhydro-N-acetylmuramic acid kinase
VQATLLELTRRTVADAIRAKRAAAQRECSSAAAGVHNVALMQAMATRPAPWRWRSRAVPRDRSGFVEAMLFAWLARERMLGHPAPGVSSVTGARGPRVLGAIYFGA